MKKILSFLLFALCLTVAANAQTVTYDFEDGTIPAAFTNDETYPWIVIDTTDDDGNAVRCIMSGNKGVASSTSAIETTVGFLADGYITFDALCMGEGTNTAWDKCIFYIDGEAQFTYGAHIAGWNHYAYNVSAGSHTFKWVYMKDSSVNPTGDAFFVDNIVFGLGTDPCEVPSNVTVSDITANSATVGWTGNSTEYNVHYRVPTDTVFFEDFEDADNFVDGLPNGWTSIDHDGDGYNWIYRNNYGLSSGIITSHSGVGVMYSQSYDFDAGALTPDNWLITPQIELGNIVKVWLTAQDPSYPDEYFAIYLSTTGNDVTDFTVTLLPKTKATGEYVEYTADLSAYAGQQGYIAIRHFNVTDEFYLNVDDFGVYNEELWTTITATGNTAELTDLAPETTYEVQVQGICESGMTEWTEPVMFTTEPAPACVIDTIEIYGFTEPVYGEHPDYAMSVPDGAHYSIDYVDWNWWNVDEDNGDILGADEFFDNEDNIYYYMYFAITPEEGCSFADNMTVAVNGETSIIDYGGNSDQGYYWAFTVGFEPACVISEVNVTGYESPVAGENSQDHLNITVLTVPEDANYSFYMSPLWYDDDADNSFYGIFDEGTHYSVGMTLEANSGCHFDDNCTFYVNGNTTLVDLDYSSVYPTGVNAEVWTKSVAATGSTTEPCVISEINIEGFTVPEWGANPDYDVEVPADADYTLDYVDWNWDDGDNMGILNESGTFNNEDYVYYMYFLVLPNEGCSFADNVTFTVNGETGSIEIENSGLSDNGVYWAYTIDYSVTEPTTEPCVISEINIEGFTAPEWGANPDYDVYVEDTRYTLDYADWNWWSEYLDNGDILLASESFDNEDYVYHMYFEVLPIDGCSFADNVVFKVNGNANIIENSGISGSFNSYWAYTIDYSVTAPTTNPCAAPTNLTATNITTNDATLGWTDNNGISTYFEVESYDESEGAWSLYGYGSDLNNPFSFSYYDHPLISGTTYRYRVQSRCSDGNWSDFSEYCYFTTMGGYCDAEVPSNLTTSDITAHSATVEWTENPDNYYNVKYIRGSIFEDFEGGLPSGWTTIDNDADGYDWYYFETNERAHSGTGVATSESYINYYGPLTPDNWLITPQINLNGTMRVWLRGQDPDYASEHFAIYLSTTNNSVDDFTITLVPEAVATGEYVEYTADLSAYAGQRGYIAIRHFNCTDMYRLNVDDFGVFLDDDWTTETVTGNSIELTGLEQGSHYLVQVQSVCDGDATSLSNSSSWSTVEFTTTEEPTCVIDTIEIYGFTEPVYGATPDYDVEVPADADYTLDNVFWTEYSSEMTAETFVANLYYMVFDIAPNEGCIFADNLTVTINNDASLVDTYVCEFLSNGDYRVFTKDYVLSVPPCETPTNVTVSDITTNNATVSWTGSLEEYNVLYGTNLINYRSDFESVDGWSIFDADGDGYNWEWFTTYREYSHSGTSFLLSRSYNSEALDPDNWLIAPTIDLGGTMSVWVRSWDDGYLDNFAIYLTTNPDYEGVEDFNIELVGETTAPYEWTEYTADLSAYVGQRGAIAIRHFNSANNWYLLVDDFSVIDGTAMTATGNSIELTDLDPETTYEVQVQGICEYSVLSAWSEPVEFTTEEEPAPACEAPTGLAASNITATTAKLEWTGSQDQYTVRYKEDAASDWTEATTTNRFFPLTGLTPATTYTAQVQGDCGSGAKSVTDWSEPVTFTTLSGTIEPGECGPAVDCEGTSYPTVKIGDVCWMAKNLAAETCVNTGNVYAYVNDQFPDEDANVETYGLLYDEEAASATGLCPEGYTLPTTEQFEYLKNNFTVEELRNSTGWVVNTGTNGTGFSWDGSGFYNGTSDNFEHMLMEGYLWAVDMTSGTPQPAMYKMMYYCNEIVRVYDFDGISASIRCVKDAEPQPEPEPEPEPFRCGTSNLKIGENSYETVQIGNQCWTKTNMREPVGEEIVSGNAEYPATEAYRFKVPSRDLAIYGYLYNWKAANMVCPTGWHLPTDAEWTQMENVVSTIPIDPDATGERGDHLGKLAAYDENWDPSSTPNTPGYTEPFDDRNLSGFSARPMGYYWRGFDAQTRYAQFWTATENPEDNTKAYDRWMGYLYTSVQRYSHSKTIGYSVRCVRDSE